MCLFVKPLLQDPPSPSTRIFLNCNIPASQWTRNGVNVQFSVITLKTKHLLGSTMGGEPPIIGGEHFEDRAFFFSQFFLLKNRHMGDFFGRLGPDKKKFRFFFGSDLWRTHFGTPFWTPFGPILDPFWTILATLGDYRGHK